MSVEAAEGGGESVECGDWVVERERVYARKTGYEKERESNTRTGKAVVQSRAKGAARRVWAKGVSHLQSLLSETAVGWEERKEKQGETRQQTL